MEVVGKIVDDDLPLLAGTLDNIMLPWGYGAHIHMSFPRITNEGETI